MAALVDVKCGVCARGAEQITKCADYWCPECEEGLCSQCDKYHSIFKPSMTHGSISVEKYIKLPSSVSEIGHHCKAHGDKYTNYCSHHDTLCCPVCISTTHRECKGFRSVQDIIKTAKTSTLPEDMELSLNDIEGDITTIIHNREHNLSIIKQQRQQIHENFKDFSGKVGSKLDSLEQNLLTELNTEENKIKTKLENQINRLCKKRKSVQMLKMNIKALKEHASDLQIFLGIKKYLPEVHTAEEYMRSLSADGSLKELNLKCSVDNEILETIRTLTFGSVSIGTGPPSLVLKTKKGQQVVKPQHSPRSNNDIKLSLLRTSTVPKPNGKFGYRGCIIHPRGKMILTSKYTSKLVLVEKYGTEIEDIPCSSGVNDVTTIDDRTIALATDEGISIINIDTKQTEKVFKNGQECYGITYHKGTLLWCEKYKGLQRMDLSDEKMTTLVKQDGLTWDSYITTHRDNIYQTNWKDNSVTCFTHNGEMLWEYKNESVIGDPTGITVDDNAIVYVTSTRSSSLVVISADGKDGKQLLCEHVGLKIPYGIYFEKASNDLLIVNDIGPAFLYHVT